MERKILFVSHNFVLKFFFFFFCSKGWYFFLFFKSFCQLIHTFEERNRLLLGCWTRIYTLEVNNSWGIEYLTPVFWPPEPRQFNNFNPVNAKRKQRTPEGNTIRERRRNDSHAFESHAELCNACSSSRQSANCSLSLFLSL